jgi:hypothetical protein
VLGEVEEPTPCSVEEGLGERGKTGAPRPSSRRRGDGTQRRSGDPKQGRSRRQPRPGRRAKTHCITSAPGKAVGVSETGGSGRSSQEEWDNTTRSEPRTRGPWWSQRRPEAGWSDKPTRDGRRAKERRRRYQTEKAMGVCRPGASLQVYSRAG